MGLFDRFRKPKDYSVTVPEMNFLLYQEGDKSIRMEAMWTGKEDGYKTFVRLSAVKHWEPPHDDIELSDGDRERIKRRVYAWFNRGLFKKSVAWD